MSKASCRLLAVGFLFSVAVESRGAAPDPDVINTVPVAPRIVTEPTAHDTDDPAIWINPVDPAASLIIGTDKNTDGALYVFGLDGKVHWQQTVRGLLRPNNVDVVTGVRLGGATVDIAVTTERYAHRLRVFRLPEMVAIDAGGIPVFEGEKSRGCMGIAMYLRPGDGACFAIISRSPKEGAPHDGYLAQYRLADDGHGTLTGTLARYFGAWSGKKEIESVAVDAKLGYVYYSDEGFGVRKYHADPDAADANVELACFATSGFAGDHEGISIYELDDTTGYILVSNQQADTFRVFPREGGADGPHDHALITSVRLSTQESDGSDVTCRPLSPAFPGGLFVAMSTDRTFQFYAWADIAAAAGLKVRR